MNACSTCNRYEETCPVEKTVSSLKRSRKRRLDGLLACFWIPCACLTLGRDLPFTATAFSGTVFNLSTRNSNYSTLKSLARSFSALSVNTQANEVDHRGDLNNLVDSGQWEEEEEEDSSQAVPDQENNSETTQSDDSIANEESQKDNQASAEYLRWNQAVDKAKTTLERKVTSLRNELEKANKVESLELRAQLLTSYLYMFRDSSIQSATVNDWEGQEIKLTLNPKYDSASDEANDLFDQVRKLKRGSTVVAELLQESQEALDILQEACADLQAADENEDLLRLVQDRLLRTSRKTKFVAPSEDDSGDPSSKASVTSQRNHQPKAPVMGTPASNIRKLQTAAGVTLLVGRNRRGNEYLTFVVARDKDIWMHARGCPGAHVLLMQRRGAPPATDDCWQLAANLAAFYSDARNEVRTETMVAEPKHLLKPRKAPLGAVKVREEACVLTGFPLQVPEEYKQAREASGQASEYRATDKAKLRKRNKQQVAAAAGKRKNKKKKASK